MKRRFLAGLAAATAVAASLMVTTIGPAAAAEAPLAPISDAQRTGGVTPNSKLTGALDPIHVDDTLFKIVTTLKGVGKQVYDCPPGATIGAFREPVAGMFSLSGLPTAIHGFTDPASVRVSPFWTSFDGSRVNGSPLASVPSPAGASSNIPWLKVKGSSVGAGVFANVAFIQRIDTKGGVAPTCQGKPPTVAVDYVANYVFWVPIKP